jgi:imidazole glycerol-phosphate synthase subunit HisF
MLRPRIIPCLLVKDKGLVKTVAFSESKYVGDPINAVKIFNEKGVDELIVLDIDATVKGAEPNYIMIENFATESRMPLCYGGGIKNTEQAKRIIGLGVEKVAISSGAIETPQLITKIANAIGNQSVVAVIDVRTEKEQFLVYTHNGKKKVQSSLHNIIRELENAGVGEIVLNSIDNDGRMKGYNISMVENVFESINVPLTILGGAGKLDDIGDIIKRFGIIGAAAGSLFVFKGVYKAVLINYPTLAERDTLIMQNLINPLAH